MTKLDIHQKFPPDTKWKVVWWDRIKYHDCEVEAITAGLAITISRRSLIMDGIPERNLSYTSVERV